MSQQDVRDGQEAAQRLRVLARQPPAGAEEVRQLERLLHQVGLCSFTEFYWVLLGFTGFYWVLLGFTGFYWVLLGLIGFR